MKNTTLLIVLFVTSLSFSQRLSRNKVLKKPKYSENSEIKVFYNDSLSTNKNNTPVATFLNGKFIGKDLSLITINQEQIKSFNIEKTAFKREDIE